MENREGGLYFTAKVDSVKFKKDLEELRKEVIGLGKSTKDADFLGATKENLTIQKNVIKELESSLKELHGSIDKIAPGKARAGMISEARVLEQEIQGEKKALEELETEVKRSEEAHRALSLKLKDVKDEMQSLKLAGKQNTDQYKELEGKALEYQSAVDQVNKSVKNLSQGGLQPLTSILSEVTGIFSLGAGAVALFSGNNETLAKIQQKLNALIALAVGAQNLHTASMSRGVTISGTLAAASTRLATALGITNIAAKGLLITFTGGLILAIPALIALYDRYIAKNIALMNVKKNLEEVNKKGVQNAAAEVSSLDKLYRAAINTANSTKTREKAVKDLQAQFPSYFANINSEVILNGKARKSYNELRNSIIAAGRAKAAQSKIDEESAKFLDEEMKIREKMRNAASDELNARGKTVVNGSGQGAVSVHITADEERASARKRLKAHTEELIQFYINRNKIIDKYTQYLDHQNNQSNGIADIVENETKALKAMTFPTADYTSAGIEEIILPTGSVAEIKARLGAIDDALHKATEIDVISELKDKKIKTSIELAEAEKRISIETKEILKSDDEKLLDSFIAAHQSFEQKKSEITQRHEKIREEIAKGSLPQEEKDRLNTASFDAEGKEISDAFLQGLQNNPMWIEAFGRIETYSLAKLKELRALLLDQLNKLGKDANPQSIQALQTQIGKIDNVIAESKGSFAAIKSGIKAIGDESISAEKKLALLADALKGFNSVSSDIKGIISGVSQVFESLGIAADSTFGNILNSLDQTVSGLTQFAEGAVEALSGIASGNILGAAAGAVKAVAGAVKAVAGWFNGDKKKERAIGNWLNQLSELKTAYDNLNVSINKVLGSDIYDAERQRIENLKQQQLLINRMLESEQSKKKPDKNKINDFKKQYNDLANEIESIMGNMTETILQTDVRSLADQLADALVGAYGAGTDAAIAYGKVAEDVMRNAIINALKVQLLEKPMKQITDQLLKSMGFNEDGSGSFDGLTEKEREQLKQMMSSASEGFMAALQQYDELFKGVVNEESIKGLKGDIKGITEKTAGALEAQINAMRVMQSQSLEMARNSLNALHKIESNTNTLHNINRNISELNSKVSKPLAGL